MTTGQVFPTTHPYIDKLTHDAYLVQVKRLTHPYRSYVEEMLSIFDQQYTMDEKRYLLDIPDGSLPSLAERAARRLQQIVDNQTLQERLFLEEMAAREYEIDFGKLKAKLDRTKKLKRRALQRRKQAEEQRKQAEAQHKQVEEQLHKGIAALAAAGNSAQEIADIFGISTEDQAIKGQ
ncbi:MAG: hypothetical protein OHK0039_00240 [Bacteroidia bacterium]